MKKIYLTQIMLAVTVLVGACSSMPASTSLLDQTRNDYIAAQNNPKVATYAALEMQQSGEALSKANTAAEQHESQEKIDKLAYLAKQQIALTQEVASRKTAEADIVSAGKERDQMRLEQRTIEANRAQLNADQSKLAAQIAQSNTEEAQRNTKIANDQAMESQRKAQEAQARNAELEAQLADLSAKKTARGIVITLGDVLFSTNQSRLNADGMRTAQKLANILQKNPQRTVLIEGFTDSTGTAAYNQDLSERRATAVRSSLQEMGVDRQRIAIRGYGESYPVAANNTAENRQLNRRVEIVLSDENGKVISR